jgi:D-alanyl-D-alanine carboxypeptidase
MARIRPFLIISGALVIAVLLLGLANRSRSSEPAAPAPATASPTPEQALTPADLQSVLEARVARGPGGMVAYTRIDSQAPVFAAAGQADRERGTAMAATDRFRIYSITKTFTALVVLQLVDEGRLSLDDRLVDLLPDPAVARLPFADRITVRQLLNHTSGAYDYLDDESPFLADAFFGPAADGSKVWTPAELLAYADGARHGPYFAPGDGVHYSNTGYILLGLIVERVTGHTYAEELQRRVIAPLGLRETTLDDQRFQEAPDRYVPGYFPAPGGEVLNLAGTNASWAWAAGGIISSAADLARFADALFTGALLSPESGLRMFTFQDHGAGELTFGFGVLRVDTPAGRIFGTDGDSGGYSAMLARVPEAHMTAVILQNWWPNDGETRAVITDVLAIAEGRNR